MLVQALGVTVRQQAKEFWVNNQVCVCGIRDASQSWKDLVLHRRTDGKQHNHMHS